MRSLRSLVEHLGQKLSRLLRAKFFNHLLHCIRRVRHDLYLILYPAES